MKQKDTVDFIIKKMKKKTVAKFRKQHLRRKANNPDYLQQDYFEELINHRCH